jgi:hypothetical protein
MSATLLAQVTKCNLKAAAFDVAKGVAGGVYKKEMTVALDLFTKLPCPETAVNLVAVCPETLALMAAASDSFVRMTPKEFRGPRLQGFEKWMESFDANLRAATSIHAFLHREATGGHISVGFHGMRDQSPLYDRLSQIGIRKGFLRDRRQFLRDTIAKNVSAYRAVIDMVCIHGVREGRERFWNGLGAESEPQLHYQSEVFFEISQVAKEFNSMLTRMSQYNQPNNGTDKDE